MRKQNHAKTEKAAPFYSSFALSPSHTYTCALAFTVSSLKTEKAKTNE